MFKFEQNITSVMNYKNVRFFSPEKEHQYRQYFLHNDQIKAVFTVAVTLLLCVAFIRSDIYFLGQSPLLNYLIGTRILFVTLSVICSIILWRTTREKVFDWTLFGWTLAGVGLMVFISFTRPADYAFDFTLEILLLFYLYILLPLPFKRQITAGTLLMIQGLIALIFYKQVPPLGFQVILISLLLGNFLGLAMSWYLNLQRRAEFHYLSGEKELREKLQQAIDELKVLKGSLPICSSCKKIRDENQHWHPIENYISDRSEAEFSHGICPDCVKSLYPQIADRILTDPPKN